jgi:hypothetical protein
MKGKKESERRITKGRAERALSRARHRLQLRSSAAGKFTILLPPLLLFNYTVTLACVSWQRCPGWSLARASDRSRPSGSSPAYTAGLDSDHKKTIETGPGLGLIFFKLRMCLSKQTLMSYSFYFAPLCFDIWLNELIFYIRNFLGSSLIYLWSLAFFCVVLLAFVVYLICGLSL